MNRKSFIKSISALPLLLYSMNLSKLKTITDQFSSTEKMPVLFLGHGSPMNAIEENQFVKGFRNIASSINTPKLILCVSAHWETYGTRMTAMDMPRTIHDFGGFPKELFDVQYPAPGSPEFAAEAKDLIQSTNIELDHQWGLDHGAWSVIKHMYPNANIPVVQLSLNRNMTTEEHYNLGKELGQLRSKGVLIVGSGNIVHNLRLVAWNKMNSDDYAFDWALKASHFIKESILNGNHNSLINYKSQIKELQIAIPTAEHYLPLLYVLSQQTKNDSIELFNDKAVAGSLTMTSIKIG